jgi:hypothetical protein
LVLKLFSTLRSWIIGFVATEDAAVGEEIKGLSFIDRCSEFKTGAVWDVLVTIFIKSFAIVMPSQSYLHKALQTNVQDLKTTRIRCAGSFVGGNRTSQYWDGTCAWKRTPKQLIQSWRQGFGRLTRF